MKISVEAYAQTGGPWVPATLTSDPPESQMGVPVVLVDGEPRRPEELMAIRPLVADDEPEAAVPVLNAAASVGYLVLGWSASKQRMDRRQALAMAVGAVVSPLAISSDSPAAVNPVPIKDAPAKALMTETEKHAMAKRLELLVCGKMEVEFCPDGKQEGDPASEGHLWCATPGIDPAIGEHWEILEHWLDDRHRGSIPELFARMLRARAAEYVEMARLVETGA